VIFPCILDSKVAVKLFLVFRARFRDLQMKIESLEGCRIGNWPIHAQSVDIDTLGSCEA
jgi:hypothetical protein